MEKRKTFSEEILLRGAFYVFINARRFFYSEVKNQGSEVLKNFQAAEGLYGKRNYIFRWEFMLISICGWLSLCVLVSLGEMFIKHAQIQLDWHLEFCHVLSQTAPRCANGTRFAFNHKLTDTWIKFFKIIFCCPFLCVCLFITEVEKRFFVNKTKLGFYSSNFTRVPLRKDVCVFFLQFWFPNQFLGQLSHFFVSMLLLFTQMLYFIRKLVILVILDRENVVFVSFCAV